MNDGCPRILPQPRIDTVANDPVTIGYTRLTMAAPRW